MIEVRFRVQQHSDVADVEAKLLDACDDERRSPRIPAVDDDVPERSGNQKGADVVRADVVEVAGDPEWLDGLLPATIGCVLPLTAQKGGRKGQEDQ